jgi:hypothetical protein
MHADAPGPLTAQERYELRPRGLHGAFFLPHKGFENWMFQSDPKYVAWIAMALGAAAGILFTWTAFAIGVL